MTTRLTRQKTANKVQKEGKVKKLANRLIQGQKGQALMLTLILLGVGGLIIAPLMGFMSTGLMAGQVFEKKTDELYAADAGIEDALWQIKNDQLATLLPTYDIYDYLTTWEYDLSEHINDEQVKVTIQNLWIPKDITAPSPYDARDIIEEGKLIVSGSVLGASDYRIKINYYPEAGEDLSVRTLGVWLPPGFTYVAGSSNLEADPGDEYYSVPTTSPHAGGQAVVWTFSPAVLFADFPGVDPLFSPMTSTITFQFDGAVGRSPEALAWITTSGVDDIPYSWDADIKVYKITSTAGSTTIDAYAIKSEMRQLGSAIAGDYRAIGNSLMIDVDFHLPPIRDELLPESDATVSDIPPDATVEAAYLYWSSWFRGEQIFLDDASDFDSPPVDWTTGARWSIHDGARFRARGGGSDADRTITFDDSLDLSGYKMVEVSWRQAEDGPLEGTDALYFAFSGDGGTTWSDNIEAFRGNLHLELTWYWFSWAIPDQYLTDNFRLRFFWDANRTNENVFIDNIRLRKYSLEADETAIFKIDGQQVYFDGDGDPQMGDEEITADRSQVLVNIGVCQHPIGYSYSSFKDVTELVRKFTDQGNATYTVGGVDGDTGNEWSYAGWSLIIIYSSPETKGHQLYLYDDFAYSHMGQNVDFDGDGQPGGTISGFLVPEPIAGEVNAAKLTVFVGEGDDYYNLDYLQFNGTSLSDGKSTNDVWNSWSLGMTEDGVDIDTFYVTWASDLLEPGDTSAQIDLPTEIDSWNLVYIILSFRSEVTTGGTVVYLIRG